MNSIKKSDDLSRSTNSERLHRAVRFLAKATVGVVASSEVSAIAAELFDLVVSDPAVKRRDRFMMDLAKRMENLEAEGKLSLHDLLSNEEAAALLLRSTQAAMRSSGEKKLQAIREAAAKGMISAAAQQSSSAQIVVGLLDRMTEYHVIVLLWENRERQHYTLRELRDDQGEEARRSFFYGQPVFTDKTELESPVSVYNYMDWGLYVERSEYTAFKLARADLVTMGLLKPALGEEQYMEERQVKKRTTPEIVGHRISELGKFVFDYIANGASLSDQDASEPVTSGVDGMSP